ncbi:hypothetical protein [Actinokineospora iranica]|uniref:TrbL/VirB6 plasmid conjugal transfer protein n=1 Tax=Actinokineospora iranica TaxID=1271860 RepID=A0A1G6VSA1_9PSEU|nr:hypothetical protein [Actinokineospora iranica]SDD56482.1 hypothetical protein SAMN05216174_11370 [Actinokineospora iranica]
MWPFNNIGASMGDAVLRMLLGAFEHLMLMIWDGSLFLLRNAFILVDRFSVFTVDTQTGPIAVLWPMMLWISGILALGLFFWQLISTTLRGGRGFLRLVSGPVQYGIALAVTVGLVAAFLAAADGLSEGILRYGLRSENFSAALDQTSFGDGVVDGIKAVVLGLCALGGILPAAVGYLLEMVFREAAIYLLVATIPIGAAGLLANVSAVWFWRPIRWMLACIAMKPALAMALVLGVALAGGSDGIIGLLAGVAILVISLICPFVLFKLFAFVDPNSDAGAAFRDALSGIGVNSYGSQNPAFLAASAMAGGGGGEAVEAANDARFADAVADHGEESMNDTGVGHPSGGASDDGGGDDGSSPGSSEGGGSGGSESATHAGASGGEAADDEAGAERLPANLGSVVSSSPQSGPSGSYGDEGGGPPPVDPPGPGGGTPPPSGGDGGGGGPKSGGSGGRGSAAAGEEAAVIV